MCIRDRYTAVQAGLTQSKVLDAVTLKADGTWKDDAPLNLLVNAENQELGDFVKTFLDSDISNFVPASVVTEKAAKTATPDAPDWVDGGVWKVCFDEVTAPTAGNDGIKTVTHVLYRYGSGNNDYVLLTPGQSTNTMEGA